MRTKLGLFCVMLTASACGGHASSSNGGGSVSSTDAGRAGSSGTDGGGTTSGGSDGGDDQMDTDGSLGDGSAAAGDGGGAGSMNDAGAGIDASADGGNEPPIPGAGSGATYYVSPSGDDANSGLTTALPWKTIAKIQATTFHPGDSVLLQGGQMFTGCLAFGPGKILSTRAAPFTLGSYGAGNFTLTANCTETGSTRVAAIEIGSINGFVLQNATLRGNGGGASLGVWIFNGTAAQTGGITVRNSDISGFYGTGMKYGGEIFITSDASTSTSVATSMDGIQIVNNVLHGSAGPKSPDDGGINGYGHGNITNVLYEGNLVYDTGSHGGAPNGAAGNGILAIGENGVVMQHNVVHDVGANTNTCGGPAGLWTYEVNNALIQFNEVYHVRPVDKTTGCDWGAYDFDQYTTNSLMQYNYSHDNYAEGYLLYGTGSTGSGGNPGWGTNVVRYNLSENDGEGFILNMDHGQMVNLYNNTVYTSAAAIVNAGANPVAFEVANHAPNMGLVANNLFVAAGAGTAGSQLVKTNGLDVTGLVMVNNDYYAAANPTIEWEGVTYSSVAAWQAATHADPAPLAVDPKLVSPGSTGICGATPSCGSGYALQSGSPLVGTAVNLTVAPYNLTVGTRDFLGAAVPNASGTGYDVGALSLAP